MAEKISVYVNEELHRVFKAAASLQGKSLSEFMVDAALRALRNPEHNSTLWTIDRALAEAAQRLNIPVEPVQE
jgi:uncharacterized protein (DUF1778 family)